MSDDRGKAAGIKRKILSLLLALGAILVTLAWIAFLGWAAGRLLRFW
jgi:hypothetical protein